VQLTGADIPALLENLVKAGIPLFRVQNQDMITVFVWLRRRDLSKLKGVAEHQGAKVKIIQQKGIYWMFASVFRRPIMVLGISFIMLLSWWVPTRIFFIQVEGNTAVPDKLILEKAAQCGIAFGANRREVRSEKMKNNLLAALPQLQWTGVNTYGCTAVISVRERSKQEQTSPNIGVCSVVADRDGIIYSCTVTNGNQLCAIGQAVRAGEVLVSGYTDCGIKIQATRARAEIFAQTVRQLTVISPLDYAQKGEIYETVKNFSIIIGKKRINFSKDSGISDPTCDKMYSQYYCVLPGGFQLPISIAVEHRYRRQTNPVTTVSEFSQVCAEEFAQKYLSEQMLSGKVFGKLERLEIGDAVCTLRGKYVCIEMIGRERSEEIIKHNG
jgi:similar to stage IV sporulation protein